MLKAGSILIILISTIAYSCQRRDPDHLAETLERYLKRNFYKYDMIYKTCNDSIGKWIFDSLAVAQTPFYYHYQLDSSFCFSTDSSRFFTTINCSSSNYKDARADDILEFGGAKINNKWYFFFISSTMVVPREYYKEDIYEPLTFEELSAISHKEILGKFFIKKEDGGFVSNEKRFKDTFFDAWNTGCKDCKTVSDFDSMILVTVKEKYKYKLKRKEILEIKEEMAKSVRPVPKKKWWQRWK
jgi:hypothetical protein